jgi:DNA-binding transcriptional regulator YhcF (GntR family)
VIAGYVVYEFILDTDTRKRVDVAFYERLNNAGLVSKKGMETIRQTLQTATNKLQETSKENEQLNQVVEQMIHNNRTTDNLKYILKQIYNDLKHKVVFEVVLF